MSLMPSPDWNGVEVRWRGFLIDGQPVQGTIEFQAAAQRFLDEDPAQPMLVLAGPIKATIINGLATVTLPATDDPDINPSGFTYLVTERLNNASGTSYSIEVPLGMADTGIELARVAPVPSVPGEPLPVVTWADLDALETTTAQQIGDLDARAVPVGGAEGQALVKASATDHDLVWDDIPSLFRGEWEPLSFLAVEPLMTSNTTPTPFVASSNVMAGDAWALFNGRTGTTNPGDFVQVTGVPTVGSPHWVQVDLGVAKKVTTYSLWATYYWTTDYPRSWRDWTLRGSNDGTNWTTVDTRSAESFQSARTKSYTVATPGSYRYYRFNVTANGGNGAYTRMDEVVLTASASGDPYAAGEYVVHGGRLWRSNANDNAGVPGTSGWTEVPLTPHLTAPNGTTWKLGVNDDGSLTTTAV